MDGGLLESNSADSSGNGGAIYQGGTFNISGNAYIAPGSERSNDVYLAKDKYVMLGSTSLANYTDTKKMTITPELWKRGVTFLGGTNVAGNYTKFAFSDSEWSSVLDGSFGKLDTGATIYVSESAISGVTGGVAGDDTNGRGTKKYPYATIQKAAKETWRAQAYTISVNGTLKATSDGTDVGKGNLQNIPNDSTNIKATSIALAGTNSATIDGGGKGSALTISKAIPVTITSLKITGGTGTVDTGTKTNGGGIYITAGTVNLDSGAKVYSNKATSGETAAAFMSQAAPLSTLRAARRFTATPPPLDI